MTKVISGIIIVSNQRKRYNKNIFVTIFSYGINTKKHRNIRDQNVSCLLCFFYGADDS